MEVPGRERRGKSCPEGREFQAAQEAKRKIEQKEAIGRKKIKKFSEQRRRREASPPLYALQ